MASYVVNQPAETQTTNATGTFTKNFTLTPRSGFSTTTGLFEGSLRIACAASGTQTSLYVADVVCGIVSGSVSNPVTTIKTQSGTYSLSVSVAPSGANLSVIVTVPSATSTKWIISLQGTVTDNN